VVLNCYEWFDVSEMLLDQAFADYTMLTMLSEGQNVRSVDVRDGMEGAVKLALAADLKAPIADNESPRVSLNLPVSVPAPIEKGQTIGYAELYAGGVLLARQPIVAVESIAQRTVAGAWRRVLQNWLLLGGA